VIISHTRAREIINEEILKLHLVSEQVTNSDECHEDNDPFPWLSDHGDQETDYEPMDIMVNAIVNNYVDNTLERRVDAAHLLSIWRKWLRNVYGRKRKRLINARTVPGIEDLLPDPDDLYCNWAGRATELGYTSEMDSFLRFVRSRGEPTRNAPNNLYDSYSIAWLSAERQGIESRLEEEPEEMEPAEQEALWEDLCEKTGDIADFINAAYNSGVEQWVSALDTIFSGPTTEDQLKQAVNILYHSIVGDSNDLIRTRMLIGMYENERTGTIKQMLDLALVFVLGGAAGIGSKRIIARILGTTAKPFIELGRWGKATQVSASLAGAYAGTWTADQLEEVIKGIKSALDECGFQQEISRFFAIIAPGDALQRDSASRFAQIGVRTGEISKYNEVLSSNDGIVAKIQKGEIESKSAALLYFQNFMERSPSGGRRMTAWWHDIETSPATFGSPSQLSRLVALGKHASQSGWEASRDAWNTGIEKWTEEDSGEVEGGIEESFNRDYSMLKKSISYIIQKKINESHDTSLILELKPKGVADREAAEEEAEAAAELAAAEAEARGDDPEAAAAAAEREVIQGQIRREQRPRPAPGDSTEADEEEESEEEAQEPTERANFVERRGSPTRGTVYIHYRNWPTHFYYYFKDGEIGVIRNKPRPPEGAVRGWHLAELGDMDLFPSGTSGWTTLYGEMRDLIRARKLAEVDRFNDTPADLGLVIPAAIPEYPDSQMRDFLKDQGRSDSQVESIMTSDRLRQALVLKMKSLGMTPAVGGRTGDIEAALPSEDAPGTSEPIGRSRTSFNRKRHTWKIPEEHRQAFDFGSGYGKARVKKIILRDSEPFEVTPELAFTGTRGPFIDVVIDVAPDNPLAGRRSLRRIGSRNQAYDDIIEYIRNNSDNFNA